MSCHSEIVTFRNCMVNALTKIGKRVYFGQSVDKNSTVTKMSIECHGDVSNEQQFIWTEKSNAFTALSVRSDTRQRAYA
jgi:hypothetical protein